MSAAAAAAASESVEELWWQGGESDSETDAIEAAMQALLMDGLAGGMNGPSRMVWQVG